MSNALYAFKNIIMKRKPGFTRLPKWPIDQKVVANIWLNSEIKIFCFWIWGWVVLVVNSPPASVGKRRHTFDSLARKSPGGGHGNPLQYSYVEERRLESIGSQRVTWLKWHSTHTENWVLRLMSGSQVLFGNGFEISFFFFCSFWKKGGVLHCLEVC